MEKMAARFCNILFMLVAIIVVIIIGLPLHQRFGPSSKTLMTMSRLKINTTLISRSNPLIIWNTDSHPVPPLDIRWFLEPMGARVLQHDFSGYCHFFNLCESRKKVKVKKINSLIQSSNMRSFNCSYMSSFNLCVRTKEKLMKIYVASIA
jgi:hypothetical protein